MEFKRGVPWYQLMYMKTDKIEKVPPHEVNRSFERAEKNYQNWIEKQSFDEITENILEKGTLKDKFASYKVLAQDEPLKMLEYLKTINELLAGKPRLQVDAMNCGVSIYTKFLLPKRNLRKFAVEPLKDAPENHLLLFYFEDRLKFYFDEFTKRLERAARAKQEFLRDNAIRQLGELLRLTKENSAVHLNILIDKFGDPLSAVSNIAKGTIQTVLRQHPYMCDQVVKVLQSRMNKFTEPAQKRALKFIGQINIKNGSDDTAKEVLKTARKQLMAILDKKDESNNKVITALMKSVQNCVGKCEPKEVEEIIDPLYRYIQHSSIVTTLPALRLLYVIHRAHGEIPIKFYEFFYKFFNSADLGSSNKHPQILNFLLEVLKAENDNSITCTFLHRLLHIGLHMNDMFAVSVLYFCAALFKEKPQLRSMIKKVNPDLEKKYDFRSDSPKSEGSTVTFPWILNMYMNYFHPSVVELATAIATGNEVKYDGDPFDDFAVTTQLKHIAGITEISEDDQKLVTNCFVGFDAIPDFDDEEGANDDDDAAADEAEN
ncbi:hypothetical protein TVAG_185890 [Trichomonas vaginalis G3]|uniref:CCAAT/enhancer-binding protein zeta n=1 Tax=Trichomonas vaginalis (strain ATCC PRA-98 / G3) TaxID=412133 RepID=A2D8N2_TRIV3|nr:ribosome biogenesis [Trichomonas vaginalis G3]EAY23281.1 hypothetical protein TVAG_185890 [Trichomonas vaginalis G3]KAI5534070.1 ribosome biogenesis [Trichomonas vaginalis G3]|eukprot:XP_001584267.1 hypothetical protein [Trichomonas vaginalis G3]